MTEPGQGYHGRLWDSPMTDELPKIDMTGATCVLCEETIGEHDDAVRLLQDYHLACLLRSILGDVAHQEGRCLCHGGSDHDEQGTYREQSERALAAMIAAGRGRWVRNDDELYDIARNVTDEVMGEGTYAEINGGNPDPRVQAAIARGAEPAVLSTYTIFAGPTDYPGRFVTRRFDVVQGQAEPVATDELSVHFTIESARNAVPPSADTCFPRSPGDDPFIVETWM